MPASITRFYLSTNSTLDAGDIESEVTPQVEEQTGTKDVAIDCPDDIEAEEGAEGEMPALMAIREEFGPEQPLKGAKLAAIGTG